MSKIKVKKSIVVGFLLFTFFACYFFCFSLQKVFAEEQVEESYYCNYVAPDSVSNQNAFGQNTSNLCWAFSGTKVIESFLYNKIHAQGIADDPTLWKNFSESWVSLAYMYYVNDPNNSSKFITSNSSGEYLDKFDYKYNNVGNIYLLERAVNAYGIVYEGNEEGQCPLTITVTYQNPEDENYYTKKFDEYKIYADEDIVKNLKFKSIVNYANQSYAHNDKTKEYQEVLSRIKHYLKNYGALSTYVSYQGHVFGDNEKYLFYSDTSSDTNHALTIIGYDDQKVFNINNKDYKGAFKTVNSTNNLDRYIWIPYEMYKPSVEKIDENKSKENNNILSNTYFLYQMESGDSGLWTANIYVVPANYASATISTFFDKIVNFFGDNVAIKIIASCVVIIFVITVIVLLINYFIRKQQTASANKNAMIKTVAKYQTQQVEFEHQKQEIEDQIQEMRNDAYKKKQRRLKRQFQKKLEELKNNQDSENKS